MDPFTTTSHPSTPSQTISEIAITGAPWLQTARLALHPGLITIIGARGSGKTALAEMIAAGCDAIPPGVNTRSFLHRARPFLEGVAVTLKWAGPVEDAASQTRPVLQTAARDGEGAPRGPRARYLSQQFVEELCASDGATSGLLREIERTVFESHDVSDRDGALDFEELLTLRAQRHRDTRAREEKSLAEVSDRIAAETQKANQLAALRAQLSDKSFLLARLSADRDKLASNTGLERIDRLTALTQAAERVRGFVRFFSLQEQQLLALRDEVKGFRDTEAPAALQALQRRYARSGLKGDMWKPFLLDYTGDVERLLEAQIARAQRSAASWRGRPLTSPDGAPLSPEIELIHPAMDLEKVPLAVLEAEIARLGQQVSLDRQTSEAFTALSRRIVTETELLAQLRARAEEAEDAGPRIKALEAERRAITARVFAALAAEHNVLTELYAPIAQRLSTAGGSLRKLAFAVRRTADMERWIKAGETLLNLRRPGAFSAQGALARAAAPLQRAWESGSAEAVAAAVEAFRESHLTALLAHGPADVAVSDPHGAPAHAWLARVTAWLSSTDHIAVRYAVEYDGVDIRHLSPGTRGIVLLLLYLGFDDSDDRPLIIDQPEENLDPKSVYDELVGLFVQAKTKRQVILVTHNANLVINTEADQVIVASSGNNAGDGLPPITYRTGSLDDAATRHSVCDILEGGERAFRERAKRLGLT